MSFTKRIYYTDTHKYQHTAKITHIDSNSIQLDSTIFHPQGGGQPSDLGTIDGIPVLKVTELDTGDIIHVVDNAVKFKIGDQVPMEIDPKARVLFARLHSAGHLIAHVAENMFSGLKAVQGHHFPNEARVEFSYDVMPNLETFKEKLTSALRLAIENNTKVSIQLDNCGRSVQFGDYPITPCGGTHVNNLSEICAITIRSVKNKNNRLRVGYDVTH